MAEEKNFHEVLKGHLEPGETVEEAEIPPIEKAGEDWVKETSKGWCEVFYPDKLEQCREKMEEKLRPHIEEWEHGTEKGIAEFMGLAGKKGEETKKELGGSSDLDNLEKKANDLEGKLQELKGEKPATENKGVLKELREGQILEKVRR